MSMARHLRRSWFALVLFCALGTATGQEAATDGQVYWDALFSKGSAKNAIWLDLDDAHLVHKLHQLNSQGLRPIDIETYRVDGKRRWAVLFRGNSGATTGLVKAID